MLSGYHGCISPSPSDQAPPQTHSQQTASATGQATVVPRAPASCPHGREPWIPDRPGCQGGRAGSLACEEISFHFHPDSRILGSWGNQATWLRTSSSTGALGKKLEGEGVESRIQ